MRITLTNKYKDQEKQKAMLSARTAGVFKLIYIKAGSIDFFKNPENIKEKPDSTAIAHTEIITDEVKAAIKTEDGINKWPGDTEIGEYALGNAKYYYFKTSPNLATIAENNTKGLYWKTLFMSKNISYNTEFNYRAIMITIDDVPVQVTTYPSDRRQDIGEKETSIIINF